MSTVLFENLPTWVPLVVLCLPWVSLIIDLFKTRDIWGSIRGKIQFIIWGMKMAFLLLLGSIAPLPEEPWILLLLFWGVLDMRPSLGTKLFDRRSKQKEDVE